MQQLSLPLGSRNLTHSGQWLLKLLTLRGMHGIVPHSDMEQQSLPDALHAEACLICSVLPQSQVQTLRHHGSGLHMGSGWLQESFHQL